MFINKLLLIKNIMSKLDEVVKKNYFFASARGS